MATVTGVKGGYLQPIKYGRNESGNYAILEWHGTRAEVLTNVPFVEGLGGIWETQQSFSGAHEILFARIPTQPQGTEDIINTWELFAQVAEKDALDSDNVVTDVISPQNKDVIRFYLNNPPSNEDPEVDTTFFTGSDAAIAFAVYGEMASGIKSVRVNVPTLRHTATASGANIVKAVLKNVGKVIKTSSLFALEGVPGSVLFALPNDTTTEPNRAYGWLKKHPTVRSAARQKVQIEREWEYGRWSTVFYDVI